MITALRQWQSEFQNPPELIFQPGKSSFFRDLCGRTQASRSVAGHCLLSHGLPGVKWRNDFAVQSVIGSTERIRHHRFRRNSQSIHDCCSDVRRTPGTRQRISSNESLPPRGIHRPGPLPAIRDAADPVRDPVIQTNCRSMRTRPWQQKPEIQSLSSPQLKRLMTWQLLVRLRHVRSLN